MKASGCALSNSFQEDFSRLSGLEPRQSEAGRKYSTYCIGGPFEYLLELNNTQEIQAALKACTTLGLEPRILGFGSNILLPDEEISGLTIKLGPGLRSVESQGQARFEVGAAMSLMTLSRKVSEQGFGGLEFAGGIPASIGGALRMNAGAHGGQMSDIVESVTLVSRQSEIFRLSRDELKFSYRRSVIPEGAIVCSVTMQLRESSHTETSKKRADFLKARRDSQPLSLPSAGSVFKNPDPARTAGMLIDQAGLRGRRCGGAQISEMHGNWIVNPERQARAAEVKQLIELCQSEVQSQFGVELERELIYW